MSIFAYGESARYALCGLAQILLSCRACQSTMPNTSHHQYLCNSLSIDTIETCIKKKEEHPIASSWLYLLFLDLRQRSPFSKIVTAIQLKSVLGSRTTAELSSSLCMQAKMSVERKVRSVYAPAAGAHVLAVSPSSNAR